MLQNQPMYAYIPASDVNRARRFYEDKIGLKPKKDMGDGVSYELGKNTAVFLYDAGKNAGTNRASQAFWKVDDVEKEVDELTAKGVRFERYGAGPLETDAKGISRGNGPTIAWFKDPAGNFLAVLEDP